MPVVGSRSPRPTGSQPASSACTRAEVRVSQRALNERRARCGNLVQDQHERERTSAPLPRAQRDAAPWCESRASVLYAVVMLADHTKIRCIPLRGHHHPRVGLRAAPPMVEQIYNSDIEARNVATLPRAAKFCQRQRIRASNLLAY